MHTPFCKPGDHVEEANPFAPREHTPFAEPPSAHV
jgi:hypothetical protein